MKKADSLWALGHKVTPLDVSADFDMVTGMTPPHTSGPPPHYHSRYSELFYILEGEMEFMVSGKVIKVAKGETVNLPPNTLHSFQNRSAKACEWLNIHSPKGFWQFFKRFGISENEPSAREKSVMPDIIEAVLKESGKYDMVIKV